MYIAQFRLMPLTNSSMNIKIMRKRSGVRREAGAPKTERKSSMNALTVVLILFSAAFVAAVLLAIFRKSGRKMWIASAIALVPLALVAILVVNTTFAQLPASSANEAQSASGRIDPASVLFSIINIRTGEIFCSTRSFLTRSLSEL